MRLSGAIGVLGSLSLGLLLVLPACAQGSSLEDPGDGSAVTAGASGAPAQGPAGSGDEAPAGHAGSPTHGGKGGAGSGADAGSDPAPGGGEQAGGSGQAGGVTGPGEAGAAGEQGGAPASGSSGQSGAPAPGGGGAGQGGAGQGGAGQGGAGQGGAGQGAAAGQAGAGQAGASGSAGGAGQGGLSGGSGHGGAGGATAGQGGAAGVGGAAGAAGAAGAGGCTVRVVINEVSPEGESGSDEYVELYNAGTCEATLAGWTLLYRSSKGTPVSTVWKGTPADTLPPGGFFVLGGSGFKGTSQGELTSGLRQDGGGIAVATASSAIEDAMAWGDAVSTHPFIEGTKVGVIAVNKSAARQPDGRDTGDNGADFVAPATRTPGKANF